MEYLVPILLFVGLGLLAGILLTVFSRVFAVKQDERCLLYTSYRGSGGF